MDGIGLIAAAFSGPSDLVYDTAKDRRRLICCDTFNGKIRAISWRGMSSCVSTVTGVFYPCGVCLDRLNPAQIFVTASHCVRSIVEPNDSRIEVTSRIVAGAREAGVGGLDGGGTLAIFNRPLGICCDSAGVLYVADHCNHAVRQIVRTRDDTFLVSTILASWESVLACGSVDTDNRCSRPVAICIDATYENVLYVACISSVFSFDHVSGQLTPFKPLPCFPKDGFITGITCDARNGYLYVATSTGIYQLFPNTCDCVQLDQFSSKDGSGPSTALKLNGITSGEPGTLYGTDPAGILRIILVDLGNLPCNGPRQPHHRDHRDQPDPPNFSALATSMIDD